MMMVRDAVRCQKGHFSAPFLVAKYGSVSERPSFGTVSCGVSISVSERPSFGTIFCGGVRFGVRKAIFRHHFLWRSAVRCQNEYLLTPFLVAGPFRCQKGHLSAPFFLAGRVLCS